MNSIKSAFFKQTSVPIDEELLDLKEELSKHHQLYEDNQTLINKMPEKEKTPISPLITQLKRSFFNQNPKNQETHRVKFIGNLIKNMTYYNNFEAFLDDFYGKREKLLFANKDPNEIRIFIQQKLVKKLEKHENFLWKLEFPPEKSDFIDVLRENLEELRGLIDKMESVTFLEKRQEDELVTEKHLYENFKQQMQDNFHFLTEKKLREIINGFADNQKAGQKLKIFRKIAERLPEDLHFSMLLCSEEEISKEKNRLFSEKTAKIPIKLEEITKKLVNLAKENGINDDISIDNGAFLLFNVEKFFKKTFIEQAKFLDFSQFHYDFQQKSSVNSLYTLIPWDLKLQDSNDFFYDKMRKNEEIYQEKRLLEFNDSLVGSWMNSLMVNEELEVNLFIEKKCREYYEQHNKELYLPEIYFEFFKGFLRLSLINSRKSLINIFSYLNFFREIEKKTKNIVEIELKKRGSKEDHSIFIEKPEKHKENPYFPSEIYEFDDNEFLTIKNTEKSEKKLINDITIKDFHEEMDYLKHVSSMYIYFKQARIPVKNTFEVTDPLKFDDIDRQELTDLILTSESRFLLEKTRLLRKYQEILSQIPSFSLLKKIADISMELIRKKPRFSLFSDSIFQSFSTELSNLETMNELLGNIVNYQKKVEEKIWNSYSENLLYEILSNQTKNKNLYFFQ